MVKIEGREQEVNAFVATAILDRLLHHSQVITIQGDSYRLRKKRRAGLASPREPVVNEGGTS